MPVPTGILGLLRALENTQRKAFQVNSKDIEILRKRQTESEDRLDRSWMPEKGKRVLGNSDIHYEISDRVRAVDCGGLGVIRLLVQQLELAETIDQRVKVLERHLPYRESDHVLNLIYNVMTGGSCLQDVEARRRDPVYLDALGARKVPAPSTEGDFLRRFDRDSIWDLMEAVNVARRKVWSNQDEEFHRQATIDVDGTIAPTDGQCKSGIGMSYTGQWSYHPLVVSLAETNEVLYSVNRSGNRPSHEGAAEVLDRAIELVRGGGFQKVLLRGDTDFTQTRHLDRWDQEGVEFLFGADASQGLVKRAEGLPPSAWSWLDRAKKKKLRRRRRKNVRQALVKKNGYRNLQLEREDVAELAYRPAACKQTYRLVVVRKQITVTQGQGRLFDETRYLFYLTNLQKKSAGEVVFSANRRCHQENVVEQLKNGVQAMRMPSDSLESNWAYLVIAAQAWNLKAWLGLVQSDKTMGQRILKMEYRRFLRQVVQIPCQILQRGRRLLYRLLNVNDWTETLLSGVPSPKRVRYG